jgi:hypothetical protein
LTALMLLTAWGRWMKPVWIAILVAAGVAQHFMLTYGAVMDTAMLANTMQTNLREAGDLLGWAFVANLLLVVAFADRADRPRAGAPHAVVAAVAQERRLVRLGRRGHAGGELRDVQPARPAGAQQHAPALHRQSDRRLHVGRIGCLRAVFHDEQGARADHRRRRAWSGIWTG